MGTGRGRPARGSDDERGRKKDHNHKGRKDAKKRDEKIGRPPTNGIHHKTPLRKDLAKDLRITLDCLTNLERWGRIEQTACAIKSEGTYFTKKHRPMSETRRSISSTTAFPSSAQRPASGRHAALAVSRNQEEVQTPLNLDTPPPEAESLPEPEPTAEEDPHPHVKTEDKQDDRAISEISPLQPLGVADEGCRQGIDQEALYACKRLQ
ncbi:hypothetical protein EJ07DRAFT_185638 [Lizonia empirigonia]|nr:hypothetical protein EJ07DRAFT_185638 [Lizonia empirigonia]